MSFIRAFLVIAFAMAPLSAFALTSGVITETVKKNPKPADFFLSEGGKPVIVYGNGSIVLDTSDYCKDDHPARKMEFAVGGATFTVIANHEEETLSIGTMSIKFACPHVFSSEEAKEDAAKAAAWVNAHWTDRFHEKVYFAPEDRDQCMLPAMEQGLKSTGREWLAPFPVHAHDEAAIADLFRTKSSVMAYRCVTSDGKRAYLVVPEIACCTENYRTIHAGTASKRRKPPATKASTPPATKPASTPAPTANRPAPRDIPMNCGLKGC